MTDPRLWGDRAACRRSDPAVFFPHDLGQVAVARAHRQAIAVCETCPVAAECLAYALANGERHGVWGGTSPSMRDRLRRRGKAKRPRLPIDHGTANGYQAHRRRGVPPCAPCTVAWRAYDRDRRLRKAAREAVA